MMGLVLGGVMPATTLALAMDSHAHTANKLLSPQHAEGSCLPEGGLADMARAHVMFHAEQLCVEADRCGLVVTISLQPLQPLTMGHYKPVIDIREKVKR